MKNWIYFATAKKAPLASTLETVTNAQFLWRSAFNKNGARIANVGSIREGDGIILAWRRSGTERNAYLCCRVAAPLSPLAPGLVIDKIADPGARVLVSAGYPRNSHGDVEGLRVDNILECFFHVRGEYGGDNAIHELASEDAAQLSTASTIPPEATTKPVKRTLRRDSGAEATALVVTPATLSVERIEIEATTNVRAFDAYVMVDWSSRSRPATGKDSVWIASGAWSGLTFTAGRPQNVRTRVQAIYELRQQTIVWRDEGKRVLVGLDFAFGYPAGFASALGLTTAPKGAWRALHKHFAASVTDSPNNTHTRDAFADECNRKVGAPGPFWGCARGAATPTLTEQRLGVFDFPHHSLEEWRATDQEARRRVTTQSVWKLNSGVSVGGQTILGIKHLDDLACSVGGYRWPFEGWTTPSGPAIWFAEIFPTLVQYPEWADEYKTRRDRTQVQSCVRRAAERDCAGTLKGDFAKPGMLNAATLSRVEGEEGWMLWVESPA
jgi:hypothetical protein